MKIKRSTMGLLGAAAIAVVGGLALMQSRHPVVAQKVQQVAEKTANPEAYSSRNPKLNEPLPNLLELTPPTEPEVPQKDTVLQPFEPLPMPAMETKQTVRPKLPGIGKGQITRKMKRQRNAVCGEQVQQDAAGDCYKLCKHKQTQKEFKKYAPCKKAQVTPNTRLEPQVSLYVL